MFRNNSITRTKKLPDASFQSTHNHSLDFLVESTRVKTSDVIRDIRLRFVYEDRVESVCEEQSVHDERMNRLEKRYVLGINATIGRETNDEELKLHSIEKTRC